MSTARRFFETFNLALGRIIALLIGAVGGLLVYFAIQIWGDSITTVMLCIGLALLAIAAAMLYFRMTFLGFMEFFTPSWWS
ncbi:MAG: hypothetical protein AAFY06_11500 [Pseudomonadota bacterium]